MADTNFQLGWTEAQWSKVNSAITEEFTKASVAGACLPCYGPVGASMETVSRQTVNYTSLMIPSASTISVADNDTTSFWTIRTYVYLNSQQVADENLSSALFAFRRAANILARSEDSIVFVGHDDVSPPAGALQIPMGSATAIPLLTWSKPTGRDDVVANTPFLSRGLLTVRNDNTKHFTVARQARGANIPDDFGENLVAEISRAIGALEKDGYPGPFACVLGQTAFVEAHRPSTSSLVLPADRITPMLGGPLLRSSKLPKRHGVVASACGEALDIVVATAPKAQFLQVDANAKYVFRVYERFVLRIKDPNAVVSISLDEIEEETAARKKAAKEKVAREKAARTKAAKAYEILGQAGITSTLLRT